MMHISGSRRFRIGYLSSWHLYEGASIEPYSLSLLRGVRSAAKNFSCSLLLACGVGPLADIKQGAPAWPFPEQEAAFVPVGPWNTDGLVVLPTELTAEQSAYLQDLRARGFPIVYVGPGEPGPSIMIDNYGGIRQAVQHLLEHRHRRIAFISGPRRSRGDTAQRMDAYTQALAAAGIDFDDRLVACGEHSLEGGRQAMGKLIDSAVPFSAVVASNDRSALGAISVLNAHGVSVPGDVAVIGFDDISETRASSPALTTLRNAPFAIGYQAVLFLLELIEGRRKENEVTILPTPLIVRRSCGCDPLYSPLKTEGQAQEKPDSISPARLASEMTEAVMKEAQSFSRTRISNLCRVLADGYLESLRQVSARPFQQALQQVMDQSEDQIDDIYAWNSAVSILRSTLEQFNGPGSSVLEPLLDQARLEIGEHAHRQQARSQFQHSAAIDRITIMSAQLLAALEEDEIRAVLDQSLGAIGVRRMLVAFLQPDESDPVAQSRVFYAFGFDHALTGEVFSTRQFPPVRCGAWQEADNLALLPLVIPGRVRGYAVFEAEDLTSLAVIVRNLESALRTGLLFADAVEGRRMAEDANQLKSRFLSMVSHELRTPLNMIVGLSEILLRQKSQPASAGMWQDLERIYTNAQHLGRLIGDVLDLVSSGTGHLRLQNEPLDLAEVLRPVIITGEQLARQKNLGWSVKMPERGPFVNGDRTRLRQVALNLVSNAVKFTFQGSVAVDVTAENGQVTVSVQDTGIGVPPADQHKIFSEFGQSDLSIQHGISGMGLGLAITRELVERQGGRVGVISTGIEGRGSTFFFTLPTFSPKESFEKPSDELKTGWLALLADQRCTGEALAKSLGERGFQLRVISPREDPQWFLRLKDTPPAVIILEDQLAANQGWDILGTLKRASATEHVPVMVSTLDPAAQTGSVLELDYQMKPLTPDQLIHVLHKYGTCGELSTILVVDDDPAIRDFHTRLIEQQLPGCRVLQAENGRMGQELLARSTPDIVLLDLMMPDVDGFAFLEKMRQQESTRGIPVIVLTAKVLTEEDVQRLNQGVAAILSKGMFSGAEILEHIESVLSKNRSLGTASQRLVRRAIAFIHARYAQALTRYQIAEHVNVSPDHLSDCFHQEMGIAPIAYLNRYRISQARKLLEQGDRNITEVAMEVGFSDSAHFSRVFQREVGTSPRMYQRGSRQQQS